jgi:hypothetical protein
MIVLFSSIILTNCGGGGNSSQTNTTQGEADTEENKLYGITINAAPLSYSQYGLSPLTDDEFNALPQEAQYKVALKLYATLFYGTSQKALETAIQSGIFISRTQSIFDQPNDPAELAAVEDHLYEYTGWGTGAIMAPILARLFHLSPGEAYLHRWAAYILTQTILFSPAYELDTVYTVDAANVYNSLVMDLDEGFSLQWITFKHMITDENWRRFRSPEDNGREMLEIFLMDFNDAHVPLAAKTLQNWQLDRQSNTLVITLDENTEPITTLFDNTTLYNGTDFYSALVLQQNFLLTVSKRLIDIYFPSYTEAQKNTLSTQLANSHPTSWTGLLKQIVYSKEYLLHSQKTRTFEESFFPIAKTLNWHPHQSSFYRAYDRLNKMHQSTMKYKLGRKTEVPLDSQSFAWFHKTMRENIMTNYENNTEFTSWDDGWSLKENYRRLPDNLDTKEEIADYIIHTLFLPILGREASPEEKQFLMDMIDSDKYDASTFNNFHYYHLIGNSDPEKDLKERGYFAAIVLDYISRLNTVYSFEKIQ